MKPSTSRRALVKSLALGAAGSLLGIGEGHAEDAKKLDVNDPAAKALGYVEEAKQVDLKKYPSFVKGSNCENCLQLQGTAGSRYRPCAAFGGRLVSIDGWCASWTPEM